MGTCKRYHQLGEPCTYMGDNCSYYDGLYCTAPAAMTSGQCAKMKANGASCQRSDECVGACIGLVCAGCFDTTP